MKHPTLGQAEWEILRHVAENHPVSVREVADHVAQTKGQARTTVLTVMERLRAKGYLSRRKRDGVYQYAPKVPLPELLDGMVEDFVENTLSGVVSPFFSYLSRSAQLSDGQIEELKQMVRDLEDQRKAPRP